MGRMLSVLIGSLSLGAGAAWAQDGATLSARVIASDGSPIAGATVFVWTARPREGPTIYCPSCYADCGKRAESAADGAVAFERLDPSLLFNLMTVADGHIAEESGMIDPGDGTLEIELEPGPPLPEGPGHIVRGRVVDAYGSPVEHAVVEPRMFYFPPDERQDGISGSSRIDGADPLAITDSQGRFSLGSPERVGKVDVRVEARGFAVLLAPGLLPDNPDQAITMSEGVTVSGVLLDSAGAPLAGRGVGMCQTDRSFERFTAFYEIDTDDRGRFSFVNMPPGQECVVYSKMQSVSDLGAADPLLVTTGASGSAIDGVELRLHPGHTLRGKVVLADGKPIPEGKGVMLLSGNTIWDSAPERVLPADGSFEFANLPTESYMISVRIPGYSVSPRNPNCLSYDGRIEGRIERDIDGFVILMQPGDFERARTVQPRDTPLRSYDGALAAPSDAGALPGG